jgi:hypothetical protein
MAEERRWMADELGFMADELRWTGEALRLDEAASRRLLGHEAPGPGL